MKVVFDYQIFTGQEYGGISRYFIELGEKLQKQSPDVNLRILAPLHRNRSLLEAPNLLVRGPFAPLLPYLGRVTRALSGTLFRAEARFSGPGILHQTYYWEGARARNYWRGPVVLTVYDMIHEKFPESFSSGDTTAREKAEAVAAADHVLCISEQTKRDLMEILGTPAEKITVTHLAHSLPPPAEGFEPLPSPYLLFVGPRVGYKNFSTLLEAYAADPQLAKDFQLVCLGGGPFTEEERAQIARVPGGESRVVYLSGGASKLAALYQRASAFIYPSLYEGFGIPPLEAMASSCPVVCGHGGSLAEVVGDAASICDAREKDSLLQAIRKVVYDESYRREMVQRGLARAALFSWDRCAQETLAVYRRLL